MQNKNGRTDRDSVWVLGLHGPKESCVTWGPAVLRDIVMATNFETQFVITGFVGSKFGCMTGSDMLFDSRGGFSVSSYPTKT